ncbi:MAG TPA: Crp/Fnr family transcriptional regulator [Vicinamibacterales bacterium]|nr:Crp/Fnr family transcriptional regulator [Vicinamibacterales bacterium]
MPFDVDEFLDAPGLSPQLVNHARGASIFRQGSPADSVFYIQKGTVKLSVLSKTGREAVVAMLQAGDFFGEGCLAGQPKRLGSATAATAARVLCIGKPHMLKLLHERQAMSDRFIAHLLARNIRIEADLVDQLFNSTEKRLARALLLLSRHRTGLTPVAKMPRVSQELLAQIVGTTRSRVNVFMKKFERLGFIDYADGLTVHSGLLTVVLHEDDTSSG